MDDGHASELGSFLTARRLALRPTDVGLPDTGRGRRRAQGLRREEVALLAAISTDYYTRIEQGRRRASEPVLDAIASALQLDPDEREYAFGLAGKDGMRPRRRPGAQKLQPVLRVLLDDLRTTPAIVLGRRMDVLAWNRMATVLVLDFAAVPERYRNYVWLAFNDPRFRAMYPDWEDTLHTCVANLRMQAARDPDDPRLAQLVGELSVQHTEFRRLWGAHHVAARVRGTKRMCHPDIGELMVRWDTLASITEPDQQLVVWTAEPGSPSHEALLALSRRLDEAPAG